MLTAVMAACIKNDPESSEGEDGVYRLTYLTLGDQAAKPLQPNDRIIAEINRRLGIDLQVQIVPENAVDKINAAFASGDWPDVVTTKFPSEAVSQWIREGIILPLDDYLDKMPSVRQKIEENGLEWTAVDGKYYGYPFVSQTTKSNYTIQFRADWLKQLGIKPPDTLDEFYEALKAVTFRDPDNNGKHDTYGFSTNKPNPGEPISAFNFVFFAYGLPYGDWALDEAGNVIPIFEHPSFRQGMAELKKWMDEKLIEPEFMVNDRPMKEQKFFQGKIGFMEGPLFRHLNRIESNLQKVNPNGELGWTAPPAGPNGDRGMPLKPKGGFLTSITKAAEQPEKAAEFIEFLRSEEGRELLQLGIEGIHFTREGDTILYNEAEREKDGFAPDGWSHPLAWGNVTWPIDENYLPLIEPQREEAQQSVELASRYIMPNLIDTKVPSEILHASVLNDLYNQYFLDMLTGKIGIEQGIAELGQKWRQQGGAEILKEVTEVYERQKKN
jgi:ABC-type glycerol-3-phosphate transport system substrate-binding protein